MFNYLCVIFINNFVIKAVYKMLYFLSDILSLPGGGRESESKDVDKLLKYSLFVGNS